MRSLGKISVLFGALTVCLLFASSAYAQGKQVLREKETSDAYVSMLFYKMSDTIPDFEQWARATQTYDQASRFDKLMVQEKLVDQLHEIFIQILEDEPIFVDARATVSKYSLSHQGFLIEDFSQETFFSFTHMGENFAVIPQGINDFQWINVDPELGKKMGKLFGPNNAADLQVVLTPISADAQTPLMLGGKKHWLILAKIDSVRVWDNDGEKILWKSGTVDVNRAKELMELFHKDN